MQEDHPAALLAVGGRVQTVGGHRTILTASRQARRSGSPDVRDSNGSEVSVGSLCRYFGDKDEIFEELCKRANDAILHDQTDAPTQLWLAG
jgi:hypothetical protein